MYVITGATGNTGNVAAKHLLAQGQKVRVIGRSAERLRSLQQEGAEPFVADIKDSAALAKAFAGATAVYAMIPPNHGSTDPLGYSQQVIGALAAALKQAGVKQAVTLSSIGADKTEKTGPVVGLHQLEEKLNSIAGLNVLHLRPGYFMENTLAQAGAIQAMGTLAGPLRADLKIPMIASRDVGEAVAAALMKADQEGHQVHELQGQRDLSMTEVASIIGKALGKPHLGYIQVPDAQLKPFLVQSGMSPAVADIILEMSSAMNSGHMRPLENRSASNTTSTPYEEFALKVFVPLYRQKGAVA